MVLGTLGFVGGLILGGGAFAHTMFRSQKSKITKTKRRKTSFKIRKKK